MEDDKVQTFDSSIFDSAPVTPTHTNHSNTESVIHDDLLSSESSTPSKSILASKVLGQYRRPIESPRAAHTADSSDTNSASTDDNASNLVRSVQFNPSSKRSSASSRKIIAIWFYHYLQIILRQLNFDITTIQIYLADGKEFKSAEPKIAMAQFRKLIRSSSKKLRKMQRDEYEVEVVIKMLGEQKYTLQQIFHNMKIAEVIDVYRVRFVIADMICNILMRQVGQFALMSMSNMSDYGETNSAPQQSIEDGFMPFQWVEDNGQSIINYLASSVSNRATRFIQDFRLELEAYTGITRRTQYFPFVHGVLILRDLVQLVNKLRLPSFYAFIRHKKYQNDTRVNSTFGIIISRCSGQLSEYIHNSEEMQSVNTLASLIGNTECVILQSHIANSTIIECQMYPVKIKKSKKQRVYVYNAHKNFTEKVKEALIVSFGEDVDVLDLNYSTYRFNTSYMDSMNHINFKALHLHSQIYSALLLAGKLKEQLIIANLLQSDKYTKQMEEYIDFLRDISKESKQYNNSLHSKVTHMQQQNNKLWWWRNRILFHWLCSKLQKCLPSCCCSSDTNKSADIKKPLFISPQRMEKNKHFQRYEDEKKFGYVAMNAVKCKIQSDIIIFFLQNHLNKELSFYTKPISFCLSHLDRFWRQIGDEYPSFDSLRLIVQYQPSLTHLAIPIAHQRDMRIMLAMAQKNGANEAVFYLKYNDLNFEVELQMNGEPWGLNMIRSMDKDMRNEYDQLDMKFVERKWGNRPLRLLANAQQMDGHCGIRKIGDGRNMTVINKSFYCQWPLSRFNPNFNFEKWHRRHGHKAFKIKELLF